MGNKRSLRIINIFVVLLMLFGSVMKGISPVSAQNRADEVVELDGSVSTGTANGVNTLSFSHTSGTGDDRLMLVGVSWNSGSDAHPITTAVFNDGSTDLPLTVVHTETVTVSGTQSGPRYAAILSLLDPPSGANGTVTINFDGTVQYGIAAGAANFMDVDQTTPLGDPVGNAAADSSSTDPSVVLTGLVGDELVFDTMFIGGNQTLTIGADQVSLWEEKPTATTGAASTEQAVSDTVTMSWDSATNNWWAIAAVPINPASETSSVSASAIPSDGVPTVGDTITVTVNIDMSGMLPPDHLLGAFTGELSWDSAVLSYNSDSGILGGFTGAVNHGIDNVTFNGAKSTGVSGSVDVITVTFDVIGAGDAGLDLEFSELAADSTTSIVSLLTVDDGSIVAEELTSEVEVDGAVSSETADDGSSISFSHTTGTGENRLMLVGISWNCGSNERNIETVEFSYGAGPTVLMLQEVIDAQAASNPRNSAIYKISGEPPSDVTGTVIITFDGSVSNGIVAGAVNFMNVDQDTPLGTPASATESSSDSPTVTLTGLDSDELVFDNLFQGASGDTQTITVGADQSEQWNGFAGNTRSGASIEQATSSSVTMSWTAESASVYVITAVPINPAPIVSPDHTVTFDANGGSGSMSPQSANIPTALNANTFTRTGYDFVEWNTVAVGGGTAYADEATYNFDADVTLYAQWVALPNHTVTFDANGGTGTMDPQVANIPTALTANAFANLGYSFIGWNTVSVGGGTAYADGAIYDFSEDITLYAQWTDLPLFTVTFNANGGSGSMSPQTANIPTALTANAFTRSGYSFDGWNTVAVGGGTAYADEAVYDFDADVTLYAQWAALPDRTVTFDANGGSGSMSPQSANIPTALNANTFTRTGHDFVEWNTESGGGGTAYADEAVYDFGADVTLYAQWVEVIPESVVASAIPSDETPEVGDSITVTINIDMSDMDAPDDLLGSFTSSLSWNPAILSYVSNSGLLAGFTGEINPSSGIIHFNGINPTGYGGSFDIFTITFNVVGPGDAALDLAFSVIANDEGGSLMDYLTINQGSVVAEGVAGIVELISSSHGIGDETDEISFAHTTGTGANRLLLVGVSWNSGDAAENIISVVFSYDSTYLALTEVITEQVTVSGTVTGPRFAAIYSLLNPPSGQAGTITISFDDAVSNGVVAGAATFKGVSQSVPLGTPVGDHATSQTGTDPSVTLSGLSGNELVFDNVFLGGQDSGYTLTVGANQTELWNDFDTNTRGTASSEPASGNSVTMSWTPGTQNWWAQVAVPINPALGGVTYYDLDISVDPSSAGTTNPAVGSHTYEEGSIVDITYSENSGFEFDSWSGDCTGSGPCQVTMTGNMSVTAHFNSVTIPITFTGEELLGRPTDDSISIKIVPDEAMTYYYEYGTSSGVYGSQTVHTPATAGDPSTVVIEGLSANTQYFYRMQYSTDGGSSWIARDEHSFYTQRAPGSTFTFDITTDNHVNIVLGDGEIWEDTLNDVADDEPDFLIDLGDTFDIRSLDEGDVSEAEESYMFQLPYFNIVSGSTPVFLVAGNHEQQEAWHLDGTANSLSVIGTNAQKKYYLNPVPDGSFYTGDESTYTYLSGDQLKEDYYAWEWGDALFVVVSPFWYTTTKPYVSDLGGGEDDWTGSGDSWDWTLGKDQFDWLKATLEGSDASYKFVLMHQLVLDGSYPQQIDYGHGGANFAHLYEWGGYNEDGTTWGWDTERPGWGSDPIHQILVNNGVSAVFHAHDHQYAYEMRDGIVYQTVPSGGFDGDGFGEYITGDGYTIQALDNPGHLRVTVGPVETAVEYIHTSATSSAYTYTISPTLPNEPPVVSDIPDQTIEEGESFATINLDDYVEDPDNSDDEITWRSSGNSELTVSIVGRVATIGMPDAEWSGFETITFTAEDPDLESDSDEATFTVTAINDPPVVEGIPDQTIGEGGSFLIINLDDYVEDPDNTDVEITWNYSGNVELSVSIIDRVATIGVPYANWSGSEEITFTAEDPGGESDSDSAVFEVTGVIEPPVVEGIPDQAIGEGGSFATINLDDYVEDPDDLDSEMTWSYSGNVELSVSIDENRVATITTTPDENWFGTETITFTAEDPDGASDSDSAVFEVMSINDPPVVSDIPDQFIPEGGSFVNIILDGYVEDMDHSDDEISWSYSGNVELSVSIVDRVATITPLDADWNGSETITFTATDPESAFDSDEVTFTVSPVNDPPVLDPIGDQIAIEDEELTFTATASDVDTPAQDLTFSLEDGAEGEVPEGASIDANSGVFSWTPTEEQVPGTYTFNVCVSDGEYSDCETISVETDEKKANNYYIPLFIGN